MAADTELGAAPDEIEHLDRLTLGEHPDDGAVHLFRFRVRAPHWSSARGWMVGAAGPYTDEGAVVDGSDQIVSTVYAAEEDDELDGHLDAILNIGLNPLRKNSAGSPVLDRPQLANDDQHANLALDIVEQLCNLGNRVPSGT